MRTEDEWVKLVQDIFEVLPPIADNTNTVVVSSGVYDKIKTITT